MEQLHGTSGLTCKCLCFQDFWTLGCLLPGKCFYHAPLLTHVAIWDDPFITRSRNKTRTMTSATCAVGSRYRQGLALLLQTKKVCAFVASSRGPQSRHVRIWVQRRYIDAIGCCVDVMTDYWSKRKELGTSIVDTCWTFDTACRARACSAHGTAQPTAGRHSRRTPADKQQLPKQQANP